MFPILLKLGSFEIHTYGFFTALGFLAAVQVHKALAKRASIPQAVILDLTFWGLIVGFLGARLLFVWTQWNFFAEHPEDIVKVWQGGLVFMGAPFLLVPFIFWYSHRHQISGWNALDSLIPGVTLAHAFGRLGCLAAGCCYGKPTDLPWGVHLHSELVDISLRGVALHPTQIYEAAGLLVVFFLLLQVFRLRKFNGQVILSYFFLYPILRSFVEIFRGDVVRGFVIGDWLSTSQFISILFVSSAVFVVAFRLKTLKKPK